MPKVKTNSSAKKRFKVTGTGKLRRKKAFKNHILTKKAHNRKKHLGKDGFVDTADEKRMKELLWM